MAVSPYLEPGEVCSAFRLSTCFHFPRFEQNPFVERTREEAFGPAPVFAATARNDEEVIPQVGIRATSRSLENARIKLVPKRNHRVRQST